MSKITTKTHSRKFPLGKRRPDGRFQKRVGGRTFYFSGSQQQALAEWLRVKDDIQAGHEPRPQSDQLTIKNLVNTFLTFKQHQVDGGDITQRSWNDYCNSCKHVVKVFGQTRVVSTLNADDFTRLRKHLSTGRGPTTVRNEVARIRALFNYAEKYDVVDFKIKGLAALKRPSTKTLEAHRENTNIDVLFSPTQIRTLIDNASPMMRCFILLGVGNGLGNNDIAQLEPRHVHPDGWLVFKRPKTLAPRVSRLWPETMDAIRDAGALPFRTRCGNKWVTDGDNALSKEFKKLMRDSDIELHGASFYKLRSCFRTAADAAKDDACCDLAMGHRSPGMAAIYRKLMPKHKDATDAMIPEGTKQRLEAIASTVHDWLYNEG